MFEPVINLAMGWGENDEENGCWVQYYFIYKTFSKKFPQMDYITQKVNEASWFQNILNCLGRSQLWKFKFCSKAYQYWKTKSFQKTAKKWRSNCLQNSVYFKAASHRSNIFSSFVNLRKFYFFNRNKIAAKFFCRKLFLTKRLSMNSSNIVAIIFFSFFRDWGKKWVARLLVILQSKIFVPYLHRETRDDGKGDDLFFKRNPFNKSNYC